MATPILTAARLRELLTYDPATGDFMWLVARGRKRADAKAGCVDPERGYIRIRIDGSIAYAHQLAVLWVTGNWQKGIVDHIDGNPQNNRWANLRDVSPQVNSQNQRKARTGTNSRLLGVSPDRKKWKARIGAGGKETHLGTFDTPEEAHAAYVEAKRRLHPGCTL